MNRVFPDGPVVAAPHGLAINGDDLSFRHPEDLLYSAHETPLKFLRIDQTKHIPKGVMGGYALLHR